MAKVHRESAGMNLGLMFSTGGMSESRGSSHLNDEALRLAERRVSTGSDTRS